MSSICKSVADTPMVLKGGTALLLCYGLDRFSEDLDFDSPKKMAMSRRVHEALGGLYEIVSLDTPKDTETVQRTRLNYLDKESGQQGKLKIEVSFRESPALDDIVEIGGIKTYTLRHLFKSKTNALFSRTAARDVYDLNFMLGTPNFTPDLNSITRLHQALTDDKALNEFEQRFCEAFAVDPLLSHKDFDEIALSLSERTSQTYQRISALELKPGSGHLEREVLGKPPRTPGDDHEIT